MKNLILLGICAIILNTGCDKCNKSNQTQTTQKENLSMELNVPNNLIADSESTLNWKKIELPLKKQNAILNIDDLKLKSITYIGDVMNTKLQLNIKEINVKEIEEKTDIGLKNLSNINIQLELINIDIVPIKSLIMTCINSDFKVPDLLAAAGLLQSANNEELNLNASAIYKNLPMFLEAKVIYQPHSKIPQFTAKFGVPEELINQANPFPFTPDKTENGVVYFSIDNNKLKEINPQLFE